MSEHPRFGTMPPLGHDVAVAPVTLDDIGEVRALQRACFTSMQARHSNEAETIAFHSLLVSGSYSAELAVSVKRQNLLGAYLDGRLVGSATWTTSREDKRAGRIRFLFVSPLFNGCGIGRRLLTEMECAARQANLEEMSARSLIASAGFFERNNYRITTYGVFPLEAGESLAVCYLRKPLSIPKD